jgi:hypothetical protein
MAKYVLEYQEPQTGEWIFIHSFIGTEETARIHEENIERDIMGPKGIQVRVVRIA